MLRGKIRSPPYLEHKKIRVRVGHLFPKCQTLIHTTCFCRMVSVGDAIKLWKQVDKNLSTTNQGLQFRYLLSQKAPTAKLPAKASRLRYVPLSFIMHVYKHKRTRFTHIQIKNTIGNRGNRACYTITIEKASL